MDKSYEWLKSVISSSVSPFHLKCCEVLIELFANQYKPGREAEEYYNLLLQDLHLKRVYLSPDA